MAATMKENIPPINDSKSSKKKRAKAGVASPASVPSQPTEEAKDELVNGEGSSESVYLKEISKCVSSLHC